jgi:hypothetical protein
MFKLTQAQSRAINAANTVDFATQEEFEAATALSNAVDIGGLVVYFKDKTLVGFYDYELESGAAL